MDKRDSARSTLDQLQGINQNARMFTAGMLSNAISKERQTAFATRLVDLASAIKGRAEEAAGSVAEGSVIADGVIDGRALPSAVRSASPSRQEIPRFADALALAATLPPLAARRCLCRTRCITGTLPSSRTTRSWR